MCRVDVNGGVVQGGSFGTARPKFCGIILLNQSALIEVSIAAIRFRSIHATYRYFLQHAEYNRHQRAALLAGLSIAELGFQWVTLSLAVDFHKLEQKDFTMQARSVSMQRRSDIKVFST